MNHIKLCNVSLIIFVLISRNAGNASSIVKCEVYFVVQFNLGVSSMSTNRSMDEEYPSKSWEESCVHIPDGLFYSQHEKNSNKGYLRLIPVSFENDVVGCDDYQALVKVAESARHEG